MYTDRLPATMNVTNITHGMMHHIPKRVSTDSSEWYSPAEVVEQKPLGFFHDDSVFFYLVTILICLLIFAGILALYFIFFNWVLKGNLDLPLPGGGMPKKAPAQFILINPFPKLTSILSRYTANHNAKSNQSQA